MANGNRRKPSKFETRDSRQLDTERVKSKKQRQQSTCPVTALSDDIDGGDESSKKQVGCRSTSLCHLSARCISLLGMSIKKQSHSFPNDPLLENRVRSKRSVRTHARHSMTRGAPSSVDSHASWLNRLLIYAGMSSIS